METTELIEKFLEGSLSESERTAVEQKAGSDPEFRKLIELHQQVNESIADEELYDLHLKIEALLKKNAESFISVKQKHRLLQSLKIAAIVILVAGVSVVLKNLIFNNTPVEERLYKKYYTPYQSDNITRSDESSDVFSNALQEYNRNNFTEAFSHFSAITVSEPQNYIAWFFRGVSSMQMGDFRSAVKSFSEIPANWNNPYLEHRNWYYALALLHESETSEALTLFRQISNEKGYYSEQANKILASVRK